MSDRPEPAAFTDMRGRLMSVENRNKAGVRAANRFIFKLYDQDALDRARSDGFRDGQKSMTCKPDSCRHDMAGVTLKGPNGYVVASECRKCHQLFPRDAFPDA